MNDVVNCPTCGAPRRLRQDVEGTSSFASADGTHAALADALDGYHALNLLEALRLVPDTGDWHGSLRIACQMAVERKTAHLLGPNQTAEQMAPRAIELVTALHGKGPSA